MSVSTHHYWRIHALAGVLLHNFEAARVLDDRRSMRRSFYHLAYFYARTLGMLHTALDDRREDLVRATLRNLTVVHATLSAMHHRAPDTVPSVSGGPRALRARVVDDSIVGMLHEAGRPLAEGDLLHRLEGLDLSTDVHQPVLRQHLESLVAAGTLQLEDEGFARTRRAYHMANPDELGLRTLVGDTLGSELTRAGFYGLTDVVARPKQFLDDFRRLTGFDAETGRLVEVAAHILESTGTRPAVSHWQPADLLRSGRPRPYQLEAFAWFRSQGYRGQVIEAPAGSGKTMIGMLCIQDWLKVLVPGESVLVLVPTINDRQQWLDELCLKPTGLQLSPGHVFAGTAAGLRTTLSRHGALPCVLILTYTALAQMSTAGGDDEFQPGPVETFLDANHVRFVILDEVHKVAEDPHSLAAAFAHLLTTRLENSRLRGVIGFSGTAASFATRLARLGLHVTHTIPTEDLIAQGYVAPFIELGFPFAYSTRERRIRALLQQYNDCLRDLAALIGGATLRRWFAAIPMAQRVRDATMVLNMYARAGDRRCAITRRLRMWEQGGDLTLAEMPLITLVQLATGWSDERMVSEAAEFSTGARDAALARFAVLLARAHAIRTELRPLIGDPELEQRLAADGFGVRLDVEAVRRAAASDGLRATRAGRIKRTLAPSITGLAIGLREWYARTGEGRVDSIAAIIRAERATRPVPGFIVFDQATRIRGSGGTAIAGHRGVAGVFSRLLADPSVTPIAMLSRELYLPHDPAAPLSVAAARFIRDTILAQEQGANLFALLTRGIALSDPMLRDVHVAVATAVQHYIAQVAQVQAKRPAELARRVLTPLRRSVRRALAGPERDAVLERLSRRNPHMAAWIDAFFDYALIAASFERARVSILRQIDGTTCSFATVPVPAGDRGQRLYNLTARLVDSDELPIDLVVVSSWARTGWNVVTPNVLIDATATRDVTAWQQLRGRAMRPSPAWTPARQEHLHALRAFRVPPSDHRRTQDGDSTSAADRLQRIVTHLQTHNKVTHIYELIKAAGRSSQIRMDRRSRTWRRTAPIAVKHRRESVVSPLTGELLAGVEHAPLVYAVDPRRDLPVQLQCRLRSILSGLDRRAIEGWLAVQPGP